MMGKEVEEIKKRSKIIENIVNTYGERIWEEFAEKNLDLDEGIRTVSYLMHALFVNLELVALNSNIPKDEFADNFRKCIDAVLELSNE